MSKIEELTDINASYGGIAKLNSHLQKIETAFQNTLSRDGSTPNHMTAELDMNSNAIINLPSPTLDHHAATKEYVDTLAFGGDITVTVANGMNQVASKSDLKGIAIPASAAAYLVQYNTAAGDRWGGIFVWRSGNQSANVTADPREAIWVAPNSATTGASGAWERLRDGAYAKVAWFGIRGDSGTTSNTPTMFQQMEDTCNSLAIKEIRYEEYNYYWSDTIVLRRNFMTHRGMGATATFFTFNHTNNGIQYGDDTYFCYRPTIDGITYIQASGTAYAHYMYHGREVSIRDYMRGTDVRNFAKVGSQNVTVTNVANNGSGLIRITVSSAQTWQTGMKIGLTQCLGDAAFLASSIANIQFNITRISSTVFDLQSTTFAGSYTSGGVAGPFTTAFELFNYETGDNMKIRDKYFVDIWSLAGGFACTGVVSAENPGATANSVGVYFRKNTSCFERFDFCKWDSLGLRRFGKGVYKDNCRVVSMRIADIMLDECQTAFEIVDDDASAQTKGTEEIVCGMMRIGNDPTATSAVSLRLKATTSTITEVTIGQFNGIGTGTIIELIGGTTGFGGNGIYNMRVADALLELRPVATTTSDGITIEGYVECMFGSLVARAQGNGTERDAVSVQAGYAGSLTFDNIQMTGLSGVAINVNSSVVDATANIKVGRIQNMTNRYNIITDTGNVIRHLPLYAGDMGVVADGTTDNTTALNAIFTMIAARTGSTLYMPKGTTLCTGQLTVSGVRVSVIGEVEGGSYLRSTYSSGPQVLIGPLSGTRADEIYFKNVTFWGMQGVHFFHQRYSRGFYIHNCKAIQLGGLLKMGDSGATSGAYIAEIRDCELGAAFPELVVAADTGFTVNETVTFGSGGTATLVSKSGTTFTLKFLTNVPTVGTTITGGTSGAVTTVSSRRPGVDFVSVEYGIGEFNVYQSRVEGGYDWTVAGLNFSNNAWEATPGVAGLFDTCGFHDSYWARFGYNIKISDRRVGNVNWTNTRFHEAGIAAILWEIPTGSTRALDRTGGGGGVMSNLDVSTGYPFSGVYAKGIVIKNDSTVNSYIGDLMISNIHGASMYNSVLELNSQRTLGLRGINIVGINATQCAAAGMDAVSINAGSTTAFSGVLLDNVNVQGTFGDAVASNGGSTPDGGFRLGHNIHAFGTFTNRINGNLSRAGENYGSAVYDPANLVDGDGVTTTVTVTGAAVGDIAYASFSNALQGIMLTAWVSAANTVSVRFQNETGGAIDLASGTIKAIARMAG